MRWFSFLFLKCSYEFFNKWTLRLLIDHILVPCPSWHSKKKISLSFRYCFLPALFVHSGFFFPMYCANSYSLKWETNWMKRLNLDRLYASRFAILTLIHQNPDTYVSYKITDSQYLKIGNLGTFSECTSVFNRELFRASLPQLTYKTEFSLQMFCKLISMILTMKSVSGKTD